ncbi:exported hypothetical protein [Streptomyces misionensis JCM 4497]
MPRALTARRRARAVVTAAGPARTLKGLDHYGQWERRHQPEPPPGDLRDRAVPRKPGSTHCERAHTLPLSGRAPGVAHWPCTRSSALRGR